MRWKRLECVVRGSGAAQHLPEWRCTRTPPQCLRKRPPPRRARVALKTPLGRQCASPPRAPQSGPADNLARRSASTLCNAKSSLAMHTWLMVEIGKPPGERLRLTPLCLHSGASTCFVSWLFPACPTDCARGGEDGLSLALQWDAGFCKWLRLQIGKASLQLGPCSFIVTTLAEPFAGDQIAPVYGSFRAAECFLSATTSATVLLRLIFDC